MDGFKVACLQLGNDRAVLVFAALQRGIRAGDQAVGHPAHGGDYYNDVIPELSLVADNFRRLLLGGGTAHGSSAEFDQQ